MGWCTKPCLPDAQPLDLPASLLALDMRARAPPRSEGLLNGHYDKHGGKIGRYNGRTLARLAAAAVALLAVWLLAMYAFSSPSGGGEAMTASSLGSDWGESIAKDSKKKHKHGDKGSRHKRHSHKHVQEGCTASPLQEKYAFPMYGCVEMQVRERQKRTPSCAISVRKIVSLASGSQG